MCAVTGQSEAANIHNNTTHTKETDLVVRIGFLLVRQFSLISEGKNNEFLISYVYILQEDIS